MHIVILVIMMRSTMTPPPPSPPPKNKKKNHFTDQCIGAFNSGMCHTSCVTTCMHNQLNSGGLLPCNSDILICSLIPCLYAHPCRHITEVGKNRSNNIKVTCLMWKSTQEQNGEGIIFQICNVRFGLYCTSLRLAQWRWSCPHQWSIWISQRVSADPPP